MEQTPEIKAEKLANLADVVAMVPHRMGFHPSRSVVLVLLDEHGRWFATARQDWRTEEPVGRLCAWIDDVASDADHVLVGVYGPREAGRDLLMVVSVCIENVARGWVMHEDGWDEAVPPGRWQEHPLEELWSSPAQLRCWSEGSAPLGRPEPHQVRPPWEAARAERWQRELEIAAGSAWLGELTRDENTVQGPGALTVEQLRQGRAMLAWDHVLTEIEETLSRGLEVRWDDLLEPLAVAVDGLDHCPVRDYAFVRAIVGERPDEHEVAMADDAGERGTLGSWWDPDRQELLDEVEMAQKVLLGEFDAPPAGLGAAALRVVLEEMVEQSPAGPASHMRCLLAWMDWANGRGSMAAAGLERVLASEPGHAFAGLLLRFVDSGTVPRWLRKGHRPLP